MHQNFRTPFHSFISRITRLSKDRRGNFAVTFALVFTVLAASAGFAVDYSMALKQRGEVRHALDAALLGAMAQRHTRAEQAAYAYDLFTANLFSVQAKIDSIDIEHESDNVIVGVANIKTQTSLSALLGVDEVDVVIRSEVERGPQSGYPLCIMAMHPTRKHTLELKGSVSLYGTECHIYGNSNHIDDVVDPHTPNNYITAASVTAVGYGHHYIQNVTPPLEGSVEVVPDPYLTRNLPLVGPCKETRLKISSATVTLDPGTYCDGIQITGNSDVTLNPGVYVIQGDELEINASNLKGSGVTIFLADRHAELNVTASTVRLVAPVSGPWTSFVVMAARDENEWSFVNSTLDLYGIIYAPNSAVEWNNSDTPDITAEWAAWITDGFSWTGNGVINFPYDTVDSLVPHPSSLNVIPRPSLREVVRLRR